jgi:hypothetical protein
MCTFVVSDPIPQIVERILLQMPLTSGLNLTHLAQVGIRVVPNFIFLPVVILNLKCPRYRHLRLPSEWVHQIHN